MKVGLNEHFTYKKLLRFVLPSVIMMVFTMIYSVVDGLFVSNFVGKTPLAAINLIFPVFMIVGAVGFMIGAGGSALVAKTLGEGDKEKANGLFSMLVIVMLILSLALIGAFFPLIPHISGWLGATGEMFDYCVLYGRILITSMSFFMLQNVFQSFFVVAEKGHLGLAVTVIAGVTNMSLDALFVAGFKWGLAGAAIATALSQVVGGLVPLIYFMKKNNSLLRLCKPVWSGKAFFKACANGSSEFLSNISSSVVMMLYNAQLMRLAGDDGVAAYSVIGYVTMIFAAIFFGYAVGSSPVVSYHYGAGNTDELKNLYKKSLVLVSITGVIMTALAEALSYPLCKMFVGYDAELLAMTLNGFRICVLSFVAAGFGVFGSAFFTALNNGAVSAVISFMRTLVFQIVAVIVLPIFMGLNGVWSAMPVAELVSAVVTVVFFIAMRKKYGY